MARWVCIPSATLHLLEADGGEREQECGRRLWSTAGSSTPNLTSLVSETDLLLAQRESREAQTTTAHLWTGLRYLANCWLWVNGNPLEYEAWPQGGQHQCPAWNLHCGAMVTEGAWETRDCQESLNFICY
jgi:hypothetical protein